MRRLIFTTILLLSAAIGKSQETETDRRGAKNEAKINMGSALFEFIEISYERVLNDDMGVGLSAVYVANEDLNYNGAVLPYFRFYPSEKLRASGFFLEANTGVVFSENNYSIFDFNGSGPEEEDEFLAGFGLGIAVGGKFVSRSGVFGEIFGGLGREFLEKSEVEVYPRFGLNFGYRF